MREIPSYILSRETGYVQDIDVYTEETFPVDFTTETYDQDNVVTSLGDGGHHPVIDIDFEAYLVPSSTNGHYQLYLEKPVEESAYFALLRALADAGLITQRYLEHSLNRGHTTARLPWVKKGPNAVQS